LVSSTAPEIEEEDPIETGVERQMTGRNLDATRKGVASYKK
jgi:hypothetical protein